MPSPSYGTVVPAECEAPRVRGASLGRSMELELIPRLLEAARAKDEVAESPHGGLPATIGTADVDAFVKACLSQDEAQSSAQIDRHITAGATLERICLDLLTPAARSLGVMWEEDTADFLEVTLGLGRMQRAVRDLGRRIGVHAPMSEDAGQAFLCGMPDEQHSLGLAMVAEFFVADGWGVTVGPPLGIDDVEHEVGAHWYDVVGLSAALKERLPRIAEVIRKIRHASLNAEVAILVGGQAFLDNAELVGRVGADASAPDAAQGPMVARTLVQARRAAHEAAARPHRMPSS
jgi:MerR family transcriptional regulator, light-induced transcriptional regulator